MHPRAVFACGACRMRGVVGANYPEGLPSGAGLDGLPQSALVAERLQFTPTHCFTLTHCSCTHWGCRDRGASDANTTEF